MQLEKAQEATDAANLRAAYATAAANEVSGSTDAVPTVTITQSEAGWKYVDEIAGVKTTDESLKDLKDGDVVTVTVVDGAAKFTKN